MNNIIPSTFWQTGQCFLVVSTPNSWPQILTETLTEFSVSPYDLSEIGKDLTVTVAETRELRRLAHTTPTQGKMRLCVIYQSDQLNHESANTLLKVLEDTPEKTRFLLLSNTNNVLPTILSRCAYFNLQNQAQIDSQIIPLAFAQDFATVSLKIGETVKNGLATNLIDSWSKEIIQSMNPNADTLRWLIEIRSAISQTSVNATALLETTYLHITHQIPFPKSLEFKIRTRNGNI
ncbi:MAG: hypothetical protein WC773_00435 [Patescibacteria group bacterium]|jgi:hypothetical protein